MKHVLYDVKKADVDLTPFPHVVVKPYKDNVIQQLIDETPRCKDFPGYKNKENHRMTYLAHDFLNRSDLEKMPTWKKFIELNTSRDYIDKFFDLFGEYLYTQTDFEKFLGKKESLKHGMFKRDTGCDLYWDAGIGINTPTSGGTSVRGPHIDKGHKVNFGLLYLRHPKDNCVGGDLELYTLKDNMSPSFHSNNAIDKSCVKVTKTIRYEAGTMIVGINSLDAIHGVTPRGPSKYPRVFGHIVCAARTQFISGKGIRKGTNLNRPGSKF